MKIIIFSGQITSQNSLPNRSREMKSENSVQTLYITNSFSKTYKK